MGSVLAVVVVRLGSSRLPGKAMLPLAGRPMLERMVERVRCSRRVGDVILATTETAEDDAVERLAETIGAGCYRGSEDDVLGRVDAALQACRCDVAAQLLGDNPLVDPRLIDDVVDFYEQGEHEWVVTATSELPHAPAGLSHFPVGVRVEVFSSQAHRRCVELAQDPHSREHSSSFVHENPELFRLGYYSAAGRWAAVSRPDFTFAVNYRRNYDLIRALFDRLHPLAQDFGLEDAVRLLDAEPELKGLMGPPPPERVNS